MQITRKKELDGVKKEPSKSLFPITLVSHHFNPNKELWKVDFLAQI